LLRGPKTPWHVCAEATRTDALGWRQKIGKIDMTQTQLEQFQDSLRGIEDAQSGLQNKITRLDNLERRYDEMHAENRRLRKQQLGGYAAPRMVTIGAKDIPSDEASSAIVSDVILMLERQQMFKGLVADASTRERILAKAAATAGFATTKAALDATTTPLPTVYVPTVVELIWKYGQARQYGTVYPLGAGTVKLPRLQAGEDQFGFIGIGTAGMSQSVPERRVIAELITFTANKAGGLIRIPTELEEDTFIPLGQFLARYIARQLAKLEDKTMFLADGTSTYANITGVGPYCVANTAYLQQLRSGKTKSTDATINDFRAMRALINPAALVDDPAYYMHPSMEAMLVTFNTIGQPLIYRPAVGPQPATLDGFPIRWVGILQPYSTLASASAFIAMFGALSYWYLGERGAPRIEVSREVFFATDEIAMRALERFDVEGMATDAMSTLQTAAQ
jgi:HK97 family phage major capsid protein